MFEHSSWVMRAYGLKHSKDWNYFTYAYTFQVTRFTDLAEFAIEEQDRKLQKSVSTSHVPQSVDEMDGQTSVSHNSVQKIQNNIGSARGHSTAGRTMSQSSSTPTLSPRKFPSSLGQKGLMERFLASRGKMGTLSSGFVTGTSPTPGPLPAPPVTTNKLADMSLDERQVSTDTILSAENFKDLFCSPIVP